MDTRNKMSQPDLIFKQIAVQAGSLFFDTTRPNSARIFDYLVGGTANFEVDRAAAERIVQIWPALPKLIRLRRAFIQEAAQVLHERGFRQFLDIASGLPTNDHLHAVLPDARVIYSDINPVAISYGESYLAHLENVAYIYGNAAEIEQILHHEVVTRLFAPGEKVAIGLNALTIYLPQSKLEEMAQKLYDWAPPDSVIFVAFQSRVKEVETASYLEIVNILANTGMPIWLFTTQEVLSYLSPWQVELFEPLVQFLGLPDDFVKPDELSSLDMEVNAALLRK